MAKFFSYSGILLPAALRPLAAYRFQLVLAFLIAAVLLPGVSAANSTGISYEIFFKGLKDRGVESELRTISDMEELRDRPPAGIGLLRSRAERDRKRFLEYFNSKGWYAAEITVSIDRDETPVKVFFHVDTGPPYLLDVIDIQVGGEAEFELPSPSETGLVSGEKFEAGPFLSAQNRLLVHLKSLGYPFPSVVDRRVTVDHRDQSVSVKMSIDPGPSAVLGEARFEGLKSIEESFVRKMVPWKRGDRYDPALLRALHRDLSSTGLFAGIKITEAAEVDEKGVLPVTVDLTERKHRSIGASLNYLSDEGPGAKLSWEHRNLMHHGERFVLGASGSDFTRDASAVFRKPYFLRNDQWLRISTRFADERPDAYESRSLSGGFQIERELDEGLTLAGGLGYKKSRITQFGVEEEYTLLSLPLRVSLDTSDDLLDPTRGGRLTIETTPMLNVEHTDRPFVKMYGRYRRYLPVFDSPSVVLAGSVAAGMITGSRHGDIPADERFYAGGGGSIRGYSYQSVGPLIEGIPYGGRSLIECSFEIRTAVTEHIGIVAFLDGGTAYESGNFSSGESFRWGSGLGFRYRTPVGPLRFDIGFPLDGRDGFDDSFQFYLSLGQAF
ncbi:MAG: autotransporter assembly complex family protein [Desulfatiglandaceae bacterium]